MEWRLYNLQFLLSREISGSAKQSVVLKLAYYQVRVPFFRNHAKIYADLACCRF